MEVWAVAKQRQIKLLKRRLYHSQQKKKRILSELEECIPQSTYKYYKIVAKNVLKLPAWHPGKGEKAWIFIDEIFFN